VSWVFDADIRAFYDTIEHGWMQKFFEHRIADKRMVRLLMKWLHAGVMEDGELRAVQEGAPQGGGISPLMSNVYLHYAFDLWVQQWRKTASVCSLGGPSGHVARSTSCSSRPHGHGSLRPRRRLLGHVTAGSKLHLGPRNTWGTAGHLNAIWGMIENVPRERLIESRRQRRARRPMNPGAK
jgi:hypothetical protein